MRRSFLVPRSSIDSMRRTCRSRWLPRRRATARRRCWPNGRGVTLLAVAWLSIDRHDNDLGRLVSYTAAALDRVDPIGSEALRPTDGRRSVATVASRVAAAMSGMKEPVVLVLDHVEALQNDECLDTIAELALHLPAGSRLALGTRAPSHRSPWRGFAPALTS